MDELIVHANKLFKAVEGLYSGFVPVPTKAAKPFIQWNGNPLAYNDYVMMVNFFKWVNEEHSCEGQARFMYSEDKDHMTIAVLKQEGVGLHTEELEGDPPEDVQKLLNDGYEYCGTAHSHCNSGAFQSGTDKDDELTQTGFHITVGKLDLDIIDIHCRVMFNKFKYDNPDMLEWIAPPDWLASVLQHIGHDKLREEIAAKAMKCLPDTPFPEEWKERVVKACTFPAGEPYSAEEFSGNQALRSGQGHHNGAYRPAVTGNQAGTQSPSQAQINYFKSASKSELEKSLEKLVEAVCFRESDMTLALEAIMTYAKKVFTTNCKAGWIEYRDGSGVLIRLNPLTHIVDSLSGRNLMSLGQFTSEITMIVQDLFDACSGTGFETDETTGRPAGFMGETHVTVVP